MFEFSKLFQEFWPVVLAPEYPEYPERPINNFDLESPDTLSLAQVELSP
jgi:hypothetical protein